MKLGLMVGYSGARVDFPIDLIKRAEGCGRDGLDGAADRRLGRLLPFGPARTEEHELAHEVR